MKINLTEDQKIFLKNGHCQIRGGRTFFCTGWYEEHPDGIFEYILPSTFTQELEEIREYLKEN